MPVSVSAKTELQELAEAPSVAPSSMVQFVPLHGLLPVPKTAMLSRQLLNVQGAENYVLL